MEKIHNVGGSHYVDLYYNDTYSLAKSIDELSTKKKFVVSLL